MGEEKEMPASGGRRTLGLVALALSTAVLAACTQPAAASRQFYHKPAAAAPSAKPAPASLVLAPAANAAAASVTDPVTATVTSGTLDAVSLADAQGKQIPGAFDPARHTWQASTPLGYNKHYTLTATATGTDGKQVSQSSPFTTVKPNNLTLPYLRANNGLLLADRQTYGVGQPIVVG